MYEGSCHRLGQLTVDAEIESEMKKKLLGRKWIFIYNVNQDFSLPCSIHQVYSSIIIYLLSTELQVHHMPHLAG